MFNQRPLHGLDVDLQHVDFSVALDDFGQYFIGVDAIDFYLPACFEINSTVTPGILNPEVHFPIDQSDGDFIQAIASIETSHINLETLDIFCNRLI